MLTDPELFQNHPQEETVHKSLYLTQYHLQAKNVLSATKSLSERGGLVFGHQPLLLLCCCHNRGAEPWALPCVLCLTPQAATPALGSGCLHPYPHSRGHRHCIAIGKFCLGNGLEQEKDHGLVWDPHSCCRLQENLFSSSLDSSAPEWLSRGHTTTAAAEGNDKDQNMDLFWASAMPS